MGNGSHNAAMRTEAIRQALESFAEEVTRKMAGIAAGHSEDQLRAPLEQFFETVGHSIGREVVAKGESALPGRLGRPDYAILGDKLLSGYVELKEPGKGANPKRFRGHDRRQWERFKAIPNLIYTDGNEWRLYREGRMIRSASVAGDVSTGGAGAIGSGDAERLKPLLTDFLSWEPHIPPNLDAKQLAGLLAPLCHLLRDDVADAVRNPQSPLVEVAADWRKLLFPDATDKEFADAYAQTVTFGLLLARSEGARTLDLHTVIENLAARHTLLSKALNALTLSTARQEIATSLRLVQRVIDCVPSGAMLSGTTDPWLYFYEDFLAAYDPALRRDAGVYYTPIEVVRAQVRLVDDLLVNRLDKPLGFAERNVVTLDPAVGTGTYLLGLIEHALNRVERHEGTGAVPEQAKRLADNLHGFENMVGPFAVSQLRVTQAFRDYRVKFERKEPGVYLMDTLESPFIQPQQVMGWYRVIAEERKRALGVKRDEPVLVCLGNPPYDRHSAAETHHRGASGGWVRWGEEGDGAGAIFNDFTEPAREAGHAGDLKNAYNLYVYFWRWALWKVFEHEAADGSGIVTFITASSYLHGDAFVGMREHMRRLCDEVWIIDLGGEGRGTRRDDNVFAIQTPVAIAVAVRYGEPDPDTAATVRYTRISGKEKDKLRRLDAITGFADLCWETCPDGWHDPFRPAGVGEYFGWPLLTDLMPWQHSGVQFKRTWPIAPDAETLERRWRALLEADDRASAFKETRDRKISRTYRPLPPAKDRGGAIIDLPRDEPTPPVERYGYRSFDRQRAITDNRVGDFLRPVFRRVHSERQVYLTSLFSQPLDTGPALTVCSDLPDLHHFRGSYGAKEAIPLYRDSAATVANLAPGLLDVLGRTLGESVSPEDFAAYVYGILAQPAFTERFYDELDTRELRVPITKEPDRFGKIRDVGFKLLWLHTYGERFVPQGKRKGDVPRGRARCITGVPGDPDGYPERYEYEVNTQTLRVGKGEFRPVPPEVWDFEVSGLKVVQSWLGYRMADPSGKGGSALNGIHPERWTAEFTSELLRLLWILEETLATYPAQKRLFDAATKGPLFSEDEMPAVPDSARKEPRPEEEHLWQPAEED